MRYTPPLQAGYECFGFLLRAAVLGIDVDELAVMTVQPSDKLRGFTVKRIEEINFFDSIC